MDFEQIAYTYGLPALFVGLFLAGLGMPIPEDVFMITGGGLVAQRVESGEDLWSNVALFLSVLYVGVMIGDSIIYGLGFRYGRAILSWRLFRRFMTPDRVERVRGYYAKYGSATVFIARHTGPIRFVSFLLAGVSRMGFWRFFFWDSLAAILSVPLWFALGFFFWKNVDEIKGRMHVVIGVLAVLAVIGLVVYMRRKRRAADVIEAGPPPVPESGVVDK